MEVAAEGAASSLDLFQCLPPAEEAVVVEAVVEEEGAVVVTSLLPSFRVRLTSRSRLLRGITRIRLRQWEDLAAAAGQEISVFCWPATPVRVPDARPILRTFRDVRRETSRN